MPDLNPGGIPPQLKKYWLTGAGSVAIAWSAPGSFTRCTKLINAKIVENGHSPLPDRIINGLCAELHHEATGKWPGQHNHSHPQGDPPSRPPRARLAV